MQGIGMTSELLPGRRSASWSKDGVLQHALVVGRSEVKIVTIRSGSWVSRALM
jgi:hypothetical protein